MKPLKSSTLAVLLGLLLVASAAATAQTTSQADQKKKAEACCSMESCCCCSGDSCPMKEEGAATQPDAKHSCCSGDSCDVNMMKTDATMKHDMKHGAKGDCCKMKQKDKTKKAA